jgi:hypothetical protein
LVVLLFSLPFQPSQGKTLVTSLAELPLLFNLPYLLTVDLSGLMTSLAMKRLLSDLLLAMIPLVMACPVLVVMALVTTTVSKLTTTIWSLTTRRLPLAIVEAPLIIMMAHILITTILILIDAVNLEWTLLTITIAHFLIVANLIRTLGLIEVRLILVAILSRGDLLITKKGMKSPIPSSLNATTTRKATTIKTAQVRCSIVV